MSTILLIPLLFLTGAGNAERISVIVGNRIVLASEVQQLVTYLRLITGDTLTADSVLWNEAQQRLIDEALLAEQAEKESIDVSRDELSSAMAENLEHIRKRFTSEEEFQDALKAEGLSERLLKERISDEVRRNLLARKLLEKAGLTEIYITPTEAERFYNEHKDSIARVPGRVELAHIFIAVKPSDSVENAVRLRTAEVLDLLARGGDFATLARSFSDDPMNRKKGGDMGWQELNNLHQELLAVLNQLQPGQISPPIRTREGYLIVKKEQQSGTMVRFRRMLFKVTVTSADTIRARRLANNIRAKALSGVPFDSLSRVYSEDPETANNGGYLGEFFLEGLMPPFNKVIENLATGEVSEPILSEHGFHIIKVVSKQPSRLLTFDELQETIRNYLGEQAFTQRLRAYLDKVAKEIYIEIKP